MAAACSRRSSHGRTCERITLAASCKANRLSRPPIAENSSPRLYGSPICIGCIRTRSATTMTRSFCRPSSFSLPRNCWARDASTTSYLGVWGGGSTG
eukprot:scaffold133300_cov65-Phaeocystis_antarctica.AAC.2